jgi:aminoglycoside phosphotransferase (APT) family kinase protein
MTAHWLDDVRGVPVLPGLRRVAEAIAPGSVPVSVRRLGGGLGAAMHRFDLALPDGRRERLVLRRYPRMQIEENPAFAERSWRTLGALSQLGVPAPRPVWADLDAAIFGTPAFVMTRLPGRSELCPRDRDRWLAELGVALARLHGRPLDGVDLSFLPGPDEMREYWFRGASRESIRAYPLAASLRSAVEQAWPHLDRMMPALCHGDFWPGNTLWLRGRLTAIVDWDEPSVAEPGSDVGYCRMDLALQHGQAAADAFLRAYEAERGERVPDLPIWDLLGAARALPDAARWLPGYHELGRRDMTPAGVRDHLDAFIRAALARAGA